MDSGIENCSVTASGSVITVQCTFHDISDVLGFQITAQLSAVDKVDVLHVSTSMDPRTPATVEVEDNGLYQVTVLPNRARMGILDTEVEFSKRVMVNFAGTATSTGIKLYVLGSYI